MPYRYIAFIFVCSISNISNTNLIIRKIYYLAKFSTLLQSTYENNIHQKCFQSVRHVYYTKICKLFWHLNYVLKHILLMYLMCLCMPKSHDKDNCRILLVTNNNYFSHLTLRFQCRLVIKNLKSHIVV